MRDDVKIGILLGFLLVVGIFVYWLVHQPASNQASPRLAGPVAASPPLMALPTPPGHRVAVVSPSPSPTLTPVASPAPTPPPSAVAIPPRATPSASPLPSAPPPILDTPVSSPLVPPTGGAVASPAPGATTTAFEALEKNPDGTRSYTTKDGESAWALAERFYGKGPRWTLLKEVNPGVDVEHMPANIKIKIPVPPAPTPVASPAPTPGATPGPTPPADPSEYVIKEGDTLTKIAQEKLGKGSLWTKIIEANPGLNDKDLKIGQKIKLPAAPGATPGPVVSPVPTPGPVVGPNEYVIKEGDRLGAIAKDKLGKESLWPEIVKLNPGLDEKSLPVGKVIKLPPKPEAAPSPSPSPVASPVPTDRARL